MMTGSACHTSFSKRVTNHSRTACESLQRKQDLQRIPRSATDLLRLKSRDNQGQYNHISCLTRSLSSPRLPYGSQLQWRDELQQCWRQRRWSDKSCLFGVLLCWQIQWLCHHKGTLRLNILVLNYTDILKCRFGWRKCSSKASLSSLQSGIFI